MFSAAKVEDTDTLIGSLTSNIAIESDEDWVEKSLEWAEQTNVVKKVACWGYWWSGPLILGITHGMNTKLKTDH